MKKILLSLSLIIFSAFFLSACGAKTTSSNKKTQSSAPKITELDPKDRPYIKLVPEEDGHWVNLSLENIPSSVTSIEYELLYTAVADKAGSDDGVGGMEIEKGLGGTIKKSDISNNSATKRLLFGTESCTNGCKYKYDTGITGGTLNFTFFFENGSVTYETPYSLKSASELKKSGIALTADNLSIKSNQSGKGYFVLLKNYGFSKNTQAKTVYSLFASNEAKLKVDSISPSSVTKADMSSLAGDYLSQQ